MKYMEKIEKRKSIREFWDRPLEAKTIEEIRAFLPQAMRLIREIDVELCVVTAPDAGEKLEGVAGYRGKCFHAPAYLVLLSEKADYYVENAGFITEDLCLKLTEMELSHCWLTVHDGEAVKKALQIESDKEAVTVLACGYGKKERTKKRLDIFTPSNVSFRERDGHVAPKISQDELVFQSRWGKKVEWDEGGMDPLLDKALYAASLAPSFLNRQPYRYLLQGNRVLVCLKNEDMTNDNDTLLDIGATMLNFDAIASQQDQVNWTMGSPGGTEDLGIPEHYEVVAYYDWD